MSMLGGEINIFFNKENQVRAKQCPETTKRAQKSGPYKNSIILVNVSTRKVYSKPITNKNPEMVERGLKPFWTGRSL